MDNAEDADIVMPMYNLLKYSDSYSVTLKSLWNCYRDKISDSAVESNENSNKKNNNKKLTSKSIDYKTKKASMLNNNNNNNILETKVVLPLKYMSNFLRSLVYHLLTMK